MNAHAISAALLWAALFAPVAAAQEATPATLGEVRSTRDGVYTKAQAKAGEALYKQHCLVCHDKNYFKPVLNRWSGQRAGVFFDVMSGSMPESNPGGLLPKEYVDILAYIFSRSRYPAGEERLSHAHGALANLLIEDS
ncbi:MAG: cytochrome c [Pseudomonadales bacterium]|nr:cytochrome c [Pseudomonadales bacterium]